MGNNFKETKLIPTPAPSLIREGTTHVDVLDNSCQYLSCNLKSTTQSHNYNFNSRRTYRPNVLSSYRLKNKLSSLFMFHPSLKPKAAFTLAEVLITLGIIGVVAAMTMPTLIMQHQKKVFATRVKQTYSIVSNAMLSSVADNGAPNTWNFGDSVDTDGTNIKNDPEAIKRLAKTYFAPYLKVVKEGTGQSGGYYLMLSNGSTLTFWTDGAIDADDIYTPDALYIIVSFNGNTNVYWNESRDYSRNDVIMTVGINSDYAKLSFFN